MKVLRTLHNRDAHIRRRLRAMVLRHWRRKRTIVRRLVRRGLSRHAAWRSVYGRHRSWWALSISWAVSKGLGNKYFAALRLVSLEERWTVLHAPAVAAPIQLGLDLG